MFLSDDKSDYKAIIVEQADEKLVFKVPQVKAGPYNLSVTGSALTISDPSHSFHGRGIITPPGARSSTRNSPTSAFPLSSMS